MCQRDEWWKLGELSIEFKVEREEEMLNNLDSSLHFWRAT